MPSPSQAIIFASNYLPRSRQLRQNLILQFHLAVLEEKTVEIRAKKRAVRDFLISRCYPFRKTHSSIVSTASTTDTLRIYDKFSILLDNVSYPLLLCRGKISFAICLVSSIHFPEALLPKQRRLCIEGSTLTIGRMEKKNNIQVDTS